MLPFECYFSYRCFFWYVQVICYFIPNTTQNFGYTVTAFPVGWGRSSRSYGNVDRGGIAGPMVMWIGEQ